MTPEKVDSPNSANVGTSNTDRRLTNEGREATKVLVVVMTDGQENSSTDYDAGSLATLVETDSLALWRCSMARIA